MGAPFPLFTAPNENKVLFVPDKHVNPNSAKATAVSGNLIKVGRGTFAGTNLMKDGVDWQIDGEIVDATTQIGDATPRTFDDLAGPVTCSIRARKLIYTGQTNGTITNADGYSSIINVRNANSNVTVKADSIVSTPIAWADTGFKYGGCFLQMGGRLNGKADLLSAVIPIGWTDGEMEIDADTILGGVGNVDYGPIWAGPFSATPTGKMRITSKFIGGNNGPITIIATGAQIAAGNAWVDIDAKEILIPGGCFIISGCRNYITSRKISCQGEAYNFLHQSGRTWTTTQKFAGLIANNTGGVLELNFTDWDDDQAASTEWPMIWSAGTGETRVKNARLKAVQAYGILVGATAKLRMNNCVVDTLAVAATSPISGDEGAVIVLEGVHLQSGSLSSIKNESGAGTLTVICLGGCTANVAVGAGVTVVGTLTVNPSFTS